jgi:hypothetical protein
MLRLPVIVRGSLGTARDFFRLRNARVSAPKRTNGREERWVSDTMKRHAMILMAIGVALLFSVASGCGKQTAPPFTLAPESALPDFVQDATPQVREAYRFAIANPDVLSVFPCYCGCGAMGHESNLDCYIKETQPDGSIVFDDHAFG